jgi:hypothetical protein
MMRTPAVAGQQRVVSLDGEALVVGDRQARFRQHERLAHIVLAHGGEQPAVA